VIARGFSFISLRAGRIPLAGFEERY
jgi:hypothetical protein